MNRILIPLLLSFLAQAAAQLRGGTVVKAAQTTMRQHTVHVLVCTLPDPQSREPQLRIILACNQEKASNCVQPLAGSTGYMEDLEADLIYEGHNVRVEWLDGADGSRNAVGAYQLKSSSAEKCEVK